MICTPPSPSVADRVKILTCSFPDDAYLKDWAAQLGCAAMLKGMMAIDPSIKIAA